MGKMQFLFKSMIIILMLSSSLVFSDEQLGAISYNERSFENNKLNNANMLICQRKADEAISTLRNYMDNVREDFDSKVLLAEAYLEKCTQIQEVMDISERNYQDTLNIPFQMGKAIITNYPYDKKKLSFGNYICAESYLLDNSLQRAEKYLDIAFDQNSSPDINFYILKADVLAQNNCSKLQNIANNPYGNNMDMTSENQKVIHIYEEIIHSTKNDLIKGRLFYKMGVFEYNIANLGKGKSSIIGTVDDHINKAQEYFKTALKYSDPRTKAMSYYYLGVLQSDKGDKGAANNSFASALKHAKDNSLKNMIKNKLD